MAQDNQTVTKPVRLELLDPHPENYNTHPEEQIEGLQQSLDRFGYVRRIVIQAQEGTGRYTVVAGEGMVTTLQLDGYEEIEATVIPADWPYEKVLACLAADNEHARNAVPDEAKLLAIVQQIKEYDPELQYAAGVTDESYEHLLDMVRAGEAPTGEPDIDEEEMSPPEVLAEKWGTAPGQLRRLPGKAGDHFLLCGDSTNAEDVACVVHGQLADAMWTDPPYGVEYEGKTADALTLSNDSANDLPELLEAAFGNFDAHALKAGAPFYIAHPAGPLSVDFGLAVRSHWHFHQTLVWVKDQMVLGHSDHHYEHEPILYGWRKGKQHPWYGGRDKTTVFRVPRPKRSLEHPTMKPVSVIQAHLINSTLPGDIVFDGFSGSGQTMMACEPLGRVARAIEIDPGYVAVTLEAFSLEFDVEPELVG